MSDLTIKQERFAQRYVELGNASEAYRQSYDAEDMSDEAIHVEASRLLDHPKVALRIEALEKLRLQRHFVTERHVVLACSIKRALTRQITRETDPRRWVAGLSEEAQVILNQ